MGREEAGGRGLKLYDWICGGVEVWVGRFQFLIMVQGLVLLDWYRFVHL